MGDGWDIVIHEDHEAIYFMKVHEIPATFDGWAEFNVANALAAIAMAHCHRVPLNTIRAAMRMMTTSFEQVPGRLNVYDGHGFRTILDYAHNPDGLAELGKLLVKMRADYARTVGVVGVAGDRRDSDILEMGAIASRLFDTLVFREDNILRGREPGSVLAKLREGALSAGCAPERIKSVRSEAAAVDLSLRLAQSGDLLVITADDVESVWQQILTFRPGNPPVNDTTGDNVYRLRAS
jgi:cyanophycin synthetase